MDRFQPVCCVLCRSTWAPASQSPPGAARSGADASNGRHSRRAQSEAPLSVPSADACIGRHSHRREAFLTTVLPEQPVESFALLRTIPPCCRPLAAAAATV